MENVTIQDEYGFVKDGLVYLKGYAEHPDRQIGEVRRTPEEALQYFRNRFSLAVGKVEQLHSQVEQAQNKGSYLTKLLQLRKVLLEFDGLGNFTPLLHRLEMLEFHLRELIKGNQAKNLEIKQALIADITEMSQRTDWNEASEAIMELKAKWLKTGPVDKPYEEEIERTFQEHTDSFFHNRREFFAEKNRLIEEKITRANDIYARIEVLQRSPEVELESAASEIKKLQNEWKFLQNELPHKKKKEILKKMKRATEFFFTRYNRFRGITATAPRVNPYVEAMQNMTKEAESLPYRPDIAIAAEKAKEMLNEWKRLSLKVKTIDSDTSNRFRIACDKVFEMNYLMRVISYRHPDFLSKPEKDRLKIQIHQMDYLVTKERNDLNTYIVDTSTLDRNNENDRLLMNKINTQKRKIAVKEMILLELRDALNKLL